MTAEKISLTEFSAFTGENEYPKLWLKYQAGERSLCGFNFWAFILGIGWFIYRKLYIQGIVIFLIEVASVYSFSFALAALTQYVPNIFTEASVGYFIAGFYFLTAITAGFWANIALYKKAIRTIREADALDVDNETYLHIIKSIGGVNIPAAICTCGAIAMINFVVLHRQ